MHPGQQPRRRRRLTTVSTFLSGNCWLPFSMGVPGGEVQPRPSARVGWRWEWGWGGWGG